MKNTKFDRVVSFVVIGTCLIKAVLYGGSKPPATTNVPPNDASAPTNEPAMCAAPRGRGQSLTSQTELQTTGLVCEALGGQGLTAAPRMTSPQLQTETEPSVLHDSSFQVQTSWTARGAYCDWTRVDFPDGFAFPHGTNLVASVTLMAYGEIRENLRRSPSDFALSLPLPVSLEPGVSTCAYGLTASNSYLFAWTDACVERSATNRVDAAIELFASGDMQVRFGDSVTNVVARPPEGFVGIGQDAAWVTNAFPAFAADIAEKGYEAWLMEDCVGINEPNGLYKLSATVAALPDRGPCYLVVGPYKTVVTAPGTYSFPLVVFNEYRAYTCPTRVHLSFSYDDGYRIEEDEPLGMSAAQSNNPNNRTMLLATPEVPDCYFVGMSPEPHVSPSWMYSDEIGSTQLKLFWNVPNASAPTYTSSSGQAELSFVDRFTAWVVRSDIEDLICIGFENMGYRGEALVHLVKRANEVPDDPFRCAICTNEDCPCHGRCEIGCSCHAGTNTVYCIGGRR